MSARPTCECGSCKLCRKRVTRRNRYARDPEPVLKRNREWEARNKTRPVKSDADLDQEAAAWIAGADQKETRRK